MKNFPFWVCLLTGATLALWLTGWVASVILGIITSHLVSASLLIFPLTSPFALLFYLDVAPGLAITGVSSYGLAVIGYYTGGVALKKQAFRNLDNYVVELNNENRWHHNPNQSARDIPANEVFGNHPIFETIAKYTENSAYEFPPHQLTGPLVSFARLYHFGAALAPENNNGHNEKIEHRDWKTFARSVLRHYRQSNLDIDRFADALNRKHVCIPDNDDRELELLLGQLATEKQGLQIIADQVISHGILGDSKESFRALRLALSWVKKSRSDLCISRLAYYAKIGELLLTVNTWQQFHLGDDHEWEELVVALEQLVNLHEFTDGLRAECCWIYHSFRRSDAGNVAKMMRKSFDFDAHGEPEALRFGYIVSGNLLDACFIYKVHHKISETQDLIRKYTERIDLCHSTEIKLNELVRIESNWSASDKTIMGRCFDFLIRRQTGFYDNSMFELENMWAPVIKNAVKNVLASTALELERYYLAQGHYPYSLSRLKFTGNRLRQNLAAQFDFRVSSETGFVLQCSIGDDDSFVWIIESSIPDVERLGDRLYQASLNADPRDFHQLFHRMKQLDKLMQESET